MIYRPSSSWQENLRAMFKRRVRDAELAYLGDTHGPGARTDVPGIKGRVYVHFPDGKDENGFAKYSPPQMVRSGTAAYVNAPGMPVFVAINRSGELEIVDSVNSALDEYGIDTRVLNPLNQQSKFVYPWQLTYGMANAVANSVTASTLVTVKKLRHFVGNLLTAFDTPLAADKIDLAAYIPASDTHCYAAVWIDTYTNLPVVTTSIAQAMTTPLDATDLQELVVRAASSRPADGIPLKAFYLSNAQTTIMQSSLDVDLRQFLDNPIPWGFPTTLTTLERVRPGYTLVTGPYTASGVGALTIEALGKVIIVHKSNVTNTAPGVGDDSGDGYSIGSQWFDTSTDTLYIASDVTVGAAVWEAVTGGGSTPPFVDTTAIVKGSADATKLLRFEVDGFTTATTRVLTPPDYDGTIATLAGAETLTNKTLTTPTIADLTNAQHTHTNAAGGGTLTPAIFGTTTQNWVLIGQISGTGVPTFRGLNAADLASPLSTPPSIGGSTPGTVYSSAFRLYIGGFAAIFTHAFTANRTVAFPGDANVTLVGEATTQTLSGKTLTTPTIADFTNATHNHSNAAGGGQLTGAAVNVTAHNAVIGNGASGLTSLAPGATRNVMISDGTDWTSRALTLADVPNLIAIFRDEKTTGTAGGTSTSTTWNARDLNTELYDPGGIVSISSNQFTPIAGDYEILVFAPFRGGAATFALGRLRLYNVTGASAVEEGMSMLAATNTFTIATLQCKFTANGTDAFRIDNYTSTGNATTGLGSAVSDGSAEVYTTVYLRKVA